MNKKILNLNISEENKILLLRIGKQSSFLSDKTDEYFEKNIQISSDKIEEAYFLNKDLISILRENDTLVREIKKQSLSIRVEHQNNFTKEQVLNVPQEKNSLEVIDNTLSKRKELANEKEKSFVLKKWEDYMKNPNPTRKKEWINSLELLEKRTKYENILEIKSMEEDVQMIKSLINSHDLSRRRNYYWVLILWITVSTLLIGVLLWITML